MGKQINMFYAGFDYTLHGVIQGGLHEAAQNFEVFSNIQE
jgi:hypothetical protein